MPELVRRGERGRQSVANRMRELAPLVDGEERKALAELGGNREVLLAVLFILARNHLGMVHDEHGRLTEPGGWDESFWLSVKKVRYGADGVVNGVELADRTGPLKILAATVGIGKETKAADGVSAILAELNRMSRKMDAVDAKEVVDASQR